MLQNGDFTGGVTHDTIYWTDGGKQGPFQDEFDNIVAPEGFRIIWIEGLPEAGDPGSGRVTGRPEVKLLSLDRANAELDYHVPTDYAALLKRRELAATPLYFPDPLRFLPGHNRAMMIFNTWRVHWAGLTQTVTTEPGQWYRFSAWAHSWYSDCSERPHEPPYDNTCTFPLAWPKAGFYLGVDTRGVIEPLDPSVIWSPEYVRYGTYSTEWSLDFLANGDSATLYLIGTESHALKHVDDYIGLLTLDAITPPQDWRRQVAEEAAILDDVAATLRAIANWRTVRMTPGRPFTVAR